MVKLSSVLLFLLLLSVGFPNACGQDIILQQGKEDGPDKTETYKGVKYLEMIPLLLKGMQEQQAEIEALKAEIEL
jgi:hypothetical protein